MKVVVFTVNECPHCAAALTDMQRRGVIYRHVDLDSSPEGLAELRALGVGDRVPVIVDHERVTVGFRQQSSPLPARLTGGVRSSARDLPRDVQ